MRFGFWQNGLRYLWTDTFGIVLIVRPQIGRRPSPIFRNLQKKGDHLDLQAERGAAALVACAPALKLMGMMTLEDCVAFCGLTEEQVLAILSSYEGCIRD